MPREKKCKNYELCVEYIKLVRDLLIIVFVAFMLTMVFTPLIKGTATLGHYKIEVTK